MHSVTAMKPVRNIPYSQNKISAAVSPIIIGVIVVVVIVVVVAVVAWQNGKDSKRADGNQETCFSYCVGLAEFECGSGKFIGGCLGVFGCNEQVDEHPCK